MYNISLSSLCEFHHKLHLWYGAHGRHSLPWRNTRDAYAIYVSEVMLQQTQVKTVLSRFYAPFLQAFPTLQALANAPQESVLKQWEGLGYYSRAANMHKAAQIAAPQLPGNVESLLMLPGIGQNTAHAIAAFAYNQPVPVMEANVKRVICRIFALTHPTDKQLWSYAFALLDSKQPFEYNQAMMDVGAMLCTKRNPDCLACPANTICSGKNDSGAYPATKTKKVIPIRTAKIIVWQDSEGKIMIQPRITDFLKGLYGFSEYPLDAENFYCDNVSYTMKDAVFLGNVNQTYSHFKMNAEVWRIFVKPNNEGQWFDKNALQEITLSGIDHKIAALAFMPPDEDKQTEF